MAGEIARDKNNERDRRGEGLTGGKKEGSENS